MDSLTVKQFTKRTNRLIENKELKSAFESISNFADKLQNWKITDRLNELRNNYKYMLHYMMEGNKDPEQEKVYNNLIRETFKLTIDVAEASLVQNCSDIFYEKTRVYSQMRTPSIDDIAEQIRKKIDTTALLTLFEEGEEKRNREIKNKKEHEQLVEELFYVIFASSRANSDAIEEYKRFIHDDIIPADDKIMFITALMLNLMQRFDLKKALFLLECSSHKHMHISLRSIVCLLPILQIYNNRWHLFPEFTNRLSLLSDDPQFKKRVLLIIIQFIQARDTEKITKKLTEEILPEMMKLSPIIGKKIKMDEWMSETGIEDKNPEWEKIIDDAGITDKLQEFSNLQMEGADVFHSTFSNLKTYPFFNTMSNWFLPFDINHTQLKGFASNDATKSGVVDSITNATFICNSDKYSFCFSIMLMPEEYRKMMSSQLQAESEQLKNMRKEEFTLNPNQEEEAICKQYIQDLYRFYKIFPRRNEFIDIFALPLDFHKIEVISSIITIPDNLEKIALYYFEKNHLHEGLNAYKMIATLHEATSEVWQKIGYCEHQLGNIEKALKAYLKSELIESNNTWTLRRIAQCYRILKEPDNALLYYRRLESLHPDNLNVKLNIGHCYFELKNYNEALENYFKVEWIDEGNRRVWRSIAWCSFLLHKFDVSQRYYQKILENSPNAHDFLNAGHVELALNNIKQAMIHYAQSIKELKNTEAFKGLFRNDMEELKMAKIDMKLIPALLDKVEYDLEKGY